MKYKRLNFIANQIKPNERVLDVGTDHALLPIFLVKNGITKNVIASDINKDPLNAAIKNIEKEKLSNLIELKLMNGIEGIKKNQFDTIVIAGMGGHTISKIIKGNEFNGRFLIHSTTNIDDVRISLQNIGKKIINEWVIFEGKIHNIIIEAIDGKMNLSKKEIFMGPSLITKNDESIINYYNYLYNLFKKNSKLSNNKKFKIEERNWLKEKLWNE